jgi:hypothetical protein
MPNRGCQVIASPFGPLAVSFRNSRYWLYHIYCTLESALYAVTRVTRIW